LTAAARVVALVIISLVVVAGLLMTSLTIWLRTAPGKAWFAREASGRLGLTLTVGRISGSLLGGIRLEDVELHDVKGRLLARADALSAHYRLRRLIRRHEIDQIAVMRPVVVRLPSATAPAAPSRGAPTAFSVNNLTITDGSFRWRGHEVQHLSTIAALYSGAQGQRFQGDVKLTLDGEPLFVRARGDRNGARAALSAELHGATFDARGHGDWANGRLTARLESLDVASTLLARAHPWAGRGALHAHGTVAGPLDALDLKLHGHTDDRGLALGALVDTPHRTARLTAFVAAPTRSAGLQARGALRDGVLDVTALDAHTGATRLTGAAQVDARGLDAALSARVAPAEAAVVRIHPAAPIHLRVALHGPPRALDVRAHGRLRAARVALGGRIDLSERRGKVHFFAKDIRVPEIQRAAPPLTFSGAFTFDGAVRASSLEGEMSVTNGSLQVEGLSFDRLHGAGRVQLGMPGEAHVDALSGRLLGDHPRQVTTHTVVRWDGRSLRCDASHAVVDQSQATGDVVYTLDPVTQQPRVTVTARTLSLSPALVQEALQRRPSRAWPGQAKFTWTPEQMRVTFALDTEQGPARGAARLRSDRGTLELPSIDVALGGSRLHGEARVGHGEVVAAIDELILQPRLVRWLSPSLEPERTLRVQGAVAGPLHALDFRLLATAGASTARLRGRVDARARSFKLVAAFDTFFLQSIKATRTSRINLELSLLGRLVEGGVAGTLTIRRAWGTIEELPLEAARLDAKLDGPRFNVEEVLVGVPGAVLQGKGGGTYRDFHVKYGVVVTDALRLKKVPESLRVIIGLTALTPGRSVVGAVERHAGGEIQFTHHAIPPPFRVVNLLFHLLTGHPLHLTVR
jgi:hypothetical protein